MLSFSPFYGRLKSGNIPGLIEAVIDNNHSLALSLSYYPWNVGVNLAFRRLT